MKDGGLILYSPEDQAFVTSMQWRFCRTPPVTLDSEKDVLAHLENHQRNGDKVPQYAIDRVIGEINL